MNIICHQFLADRSLVAILNKKFYQDWKSPSSNTFH